MNSQPHASTALPWGKSLQYPLNRRLGELPTQSGYFREGKIHLSLPRIKLISHTPSVISLVTILPELS